MGETTLISWTNHTVNFWVGCTKVSAGCKNCYMFAGQKRWGRDPEVVRRTSPEKWAEPLKWNRRAAARGIRELVFTCSWSDFFHQDADAWRAEAWALIKATPNLEYQVLTKRPERIRECLPPDWGPNGYSNVWLGTSVETQKYADQRLPHLLANPAKVHFISAEPLLGHVDLTNWFWDYITPVTIERVLMPNGISWVIAGGESGPGWRPMDSEWARDLYEQCKDAGVAFWGKQRAGPVNELPLLIDGAERKEFPRTWRPTIQSPIAEVVAP